MDAKTIEGLGFTALAKLSRLNFMIIGIFCSVEDGFAGQLYGMGLEQTPIAVVPSESGKTYGFLIAGKDVGASIEIGRAVRRSGKDGGFLEVKIDMPILPAPVTATMKLKPSREGIYNLEWRR
jgi:uncharacterized protein (DUF736 family)